MSATCDRPSSTARREFLKFLAASPYVAAAGGLGAFLRMPAASAQRVGRWRRAHHRPGQRPQRVRFRGSGAPEGVGGHWAYMASGVDDDATLRANRAVFARVQLRPRRLHDATLVDTRVELFGTVYNSPIFLCPTGGEGSFFPDGEAVVARAAAGAARCSACPR